MSPGAEGRGKRAGGGVASGHAALFVVQWLFGLFPVFGLLAMDSERGFHPFTVAAWRIAAGALVITLLARLSRGGLRLERRDRGRMLLCSLLGIVANQGLYLSGLQRSTAMNAGLMMIMIPVFTFALAALVGQERFRWSRACGVVLSLLGVLPLVLGGGALELGRYAVGNLLMAANCFCFSIYLVLSKPLRARYPAVVVLAWNYLMALPFLPLFLWGHPWTPAAPGDQGVWLSLVYVVAGPTILGYLLNVYALGRVRASTTAVYVYVQPVISALGGAAILGERLTPAVALSAAALFAGIYLVSRRPPTPTLPDRGAAAEPRPS